MTTKIKPKLGKNAESFANHIHQGLEFSEINIRNFSPCVIKGRGKNKDEIGFGINQIENDHKTLCCCFEDGLSFGSVCTTGFKGENSSLPINKKQKATELAQLILTAILTKQPIDVPQCPECSE